MTFDERNDDILASLGEALANDDLDLVSGGMELLDSLKLVINVIGSCLPGITIVVS